MSETLLVDVEVPIIPRSQLPPDRQSVGDRVETIEVSMPINKEEEATCPFSDAHDAQESDHYQKKPCSGCVLELHYVLHSSASPPVRFRHPSKSFSHM